jgi:ferritin-like metal-binding protein YciE
VKIGQALRQLHEAERALGEDFRTIGERHPADPEVSEMFQSLAEQCERHVEELRPHAKRYGIDVREDGEPAAWQDLFDMVRHGDYEVIGRQIDAGLSLLRDLRQLFLTAEDTSIRWVIIGEAARAADDQELLDVVRKCHAETETQVEWLTTRIKLAAPQALGPS